MYVNLEAESAVPSITAKLTFSVYSIIFDKQSNKLLLNCAFVSNGMGVSIPSV